MLWVLNRMPCVSGLYIFTYGKNLKVYDKKNKTKLYDIR